MEQTTMYRGEFGNRRRFGSVKSAVNSYGERITEGNQATKKPQKNMSEPSTRTRGLHQARRDISRLSESRRVAETVKAQAESELHSAKKTVKELTSMIEESNAKAKQRNRDIEVMKKPGKCDEEWALAVRNSKNQRHTEVMRELEYIKQELSKLKLDMATVLEEKSRAVKEIEGSSSKLCSYLSSAESIRKEIDEVNEEQVLVELAQIEALKELGAIEAQREEETIHFLSEIEANRKKKNEVIQEVERAKQLETQLAVTNSDFKVLKNELKLVCEMEKKVQREESVMRSNGSFRKELEWTPLLLSINEELEAAKKELVKVRDEGFQFMASMDIIRNELKHVSVETARLRKAEEETDATIESLNSKLLRAKAKLGAVTASGEKAKTFVSNLTLTYEQLKTEMEAAKKVKEIIMEETASIKVEIKKTESEIDSMEEELQLAMQELETVQSTEAIALENLKALTETTMRARASASQHSSTITITKFEYEYLAGRAVAAEEIADKKVAAAQAWIEALKASEKEILMKIELAHREVRELRVEEEKEVYKTVKSLNAKRVVEGELRNWRQKREKNAERDNMQLQGALPKKSINGNMTPGRRAKLRKPASPGMRQLSRSTSFTIKKKRRVMLNLGKLFIGKRMLKEEVV
ncbi:WEB family [Dillenia turbinata]|uniref:WEB family n=1 Tax=Dillenia turbinata TaxID=194707 RepID=A0AAN8ZBV8_9MAGN